MSRGGPALSPYELVHRDASHLATGNQKDLGALVQIRYASEEPVGTFGKYGLPYLGSIGLSACGKGDGPKTVSLNDCGG